MISILPCLILALSIVGCNSEDDPTPQPQPEQTTLNLAGTSWQSYVENDYTYYYNNYPILMLCSQMTTIDLNDDSNGEIFVEVSVEVPDVPNASQHLSFSDPFTYAFKDNTLTLTTIDGDPDGILTFHPADTTFTIPLDEPEAVEILGVDTLIFRLIQGSIK